MIDGTFRSQLSTVQAVLGYDRDLRWTSSCSESDAACFCAFPLRGEARLLLPLEPRVQAVLVAAFASRRLDSKAALVGLAVGLSAVKKLGIVRTWCLPRISKEDQFLRSFIGQLLDRSDFEFGIRLAAHRPNGKPVVAVVSDDGEMLAFAKLGQNRLTQSLIDHEGEVLNSLKGARLAVGIPEVLFWGDYREFRILVTRATSLTALPRNPGVALRAIDHMAESGGTSAGPLGSSAYWQSEMARLGSCHIDGGAASALMVAAREIEQLWGNVVFDFGFGHGDFTRHNVGLSRGEVVAHDWERSRTDQPRGLDVAHFVLLELTQDGPPRPAVYHRALNRALVAASLWGRGPAEALMSLALLEMSTRFLEGDAVGLGTGGQKFLRLLTEVLDYVRG